MHYKLETFFGHVTEIKSCNTIASPFYTIQTSIPTVSSFQIACSCVPSITAVNIANSKASKIKNRSSITVAGGE